MKIRKIVSGILKFMIFALIIGGVFLCIGGVGSYECDDITFGQFIFQLLLSLVLILLSVIVYIIRERFNFSSYQYMLNIHSKY